MYVPSKYKNINFSQFKVPNQKFEDFIGTTPGNLPDPDITYHPDGKTVYKIIYLNNDGKFHREDGPAELYWDKTGILKLITWWQDGQIHRSDSGPAKELWFANGRIAIREWYVNGKLHRLGAPAHQSWDINGNLLRELWSPRGQ